MRRPKRLKFNNKKVKTKDGVFDSKSERRYYDILLDLQEQGFIKEIKRQVVYKLPNASTVSNRGSYYKADYVLIDHKDREHVIDVKGYLEPASRIKIAFVEYMYGIEVKIIKTSERRSGVGANGNWKYGVYDTSFITED